MVNCACAVEALSWRAISGSDGRYMSVVSGPIALNAASKVVSANVPGRSMGRIGLSRYPGPTWCESKRLARIQAVAMEICAVGIQPGLGAAHVRANALNQPPEATRVIHLDEVGNLVGGKIFEHERRSHHQSPGIGEHAARGARTPAAGLVAHCHALERDAKGLCGRLARRLQVTLGFALEIIVHPA